MPSWSRGLPAGNRRCGRYSVAVVAALILTGCAADQPPPRRITVDSAQKDRAVAQNEWVEIRSVDAVCRFRLASVPLQWNATAGTWEVNVRVRQRLERICAVPPELRPSRKKTQR
jgi:hypothetical protein